MAIAPGDRLNASDLATAFYNTVILQLDPPVNTAARGSGGGWGSVVKAYGAQADTLNKGVEARPENIANVSAASDPRFGSTAELSSLVAVQNALNTELNKFAATTVVNRLVANVAFTALHALAMSLTRVRQVRAVYRITYINNAGTRTPDIAVSRALTALGVNQALYFPIPTGNLPQIGVAAPPGGTRPDIVNDTAVNNFIAQLRDAVNARRRGDSNTYVTDIHMCHSNCHHNCHGSRSRR